MDVKHGMGNTRMAISEQDVAKKNKKLIDICSYPVINVLDILIQDKSTKKNIIWATDSYEELGEGFTDKVQISAKPLLRQADVICPRIQKSEEAQAQRTRKKAEVFTPAWLCNRMNNYCDDEWFGRRGVFNTENADNTWTVSEGKIEFPEDKTWQQYVDSRRLEITCGEAPYLVSRYDTSTGELIVPPLRRIGILDRKLRIVNDNTDRYEEWLNWTIRAFEACYGYEYQGDNVLLARINLLLTFTDYYEERWQRQPDDKLLHQIANKIVWNVWQMDGLKNTVPNGKPYEEYKQLSIFEMVGIGEENEPEAVPSKINNWRSKTSLRFMDLKESFAMGKKLFDYVIGNPPYQEDIKKKGDRANPLYHYFMDASYEIGKKVELITPARFLFDAGQTPKAWNKKMLNDSHFKVLFFESNAAKVFSNTGFKGGVAITYHDDEKEYGPIGTFTIYPELNTIISKVDSFERKAPRIDSIIASQGLFRFSSKLFEDYPVVEKMLGDGTGAKIVSSIVPLMTDVFNINPFSDSIRFLGRINGKREYRYINRKYVADNPYIDKYKLFLPEANNSGRFGEALTEPTVGVPGDGSADTFLNAGKFDTEAEAHNLYTYFKTKFFRTLLGVKKVTQHCPPTVWKLIPLQNFASSSDIDWSKSVHEIDLQLYRKYGLDDNEIDFIETHVEEMA